MSDELTAAIEVTLDRDGELREVLEADHLAKLLLGFEHPAAVQRSPISPELQCLTLRCVRLTVSIIDSHGFLDSSVRFSFPLIPS